MTEKEILERAKRYVDSLANGINPLTDEPIDENDVVNNIRISRCLFYVSGVLDKVLRGDKSVIPKSKRLDFAISAEQLEGFQYSEVPLYVSEIADRISALSSDENMKRLSANKITKWLVQSGFMERRTEPTGRVKRYVTPAGIEIGLFQEERDSRHGKYLATLYSIDAQRFIIDNIEAILAA